MSLRRCLSHRIAWLFAVLLLSGLSTAYAGTGTITGTVSSPANQQGDIYLLAIALTNADTGSSAVAKLRALETQTHPAQSPLVAGWAKLSAPGAYAITLPAPGDYLIYGWVDVNCNQAVEHQDYLEASGWHQTPDHLSPVKITLQAGQETQGIDLRLISPTPYPEEELSITRGAGGGTLKTLRGNKVLHLWGAPEERAYAHGYLAARQIVEFFEYLLLEYYTGSVQLYEQGFLPFVRHRLATKRLYGNELEAMLNGMRARGADLLVQTLGREMIVDDLAAVNSFTALPYYLRYRREFSTRSSQVPLCSAAVAWGDRTRASELGGQLILGKNMDGETDLRKVSVNTLLLIAVEPDAASGLKKYLGVDWPGFLGTNNAMNQDGLVVAPHASMTVPDLSAADFLGYTLIYRQTMERCANLAEARSLWEVMPITRVGGWNTTMAAPQASSGGVPCAGVYETDSFGGLMRWPGDFTPPAGNDCLLVTNNFFAYQGVNPSAVAATHAYHAEVEPANYRYQAMLDLLDSYEQQGQGVGTSQMIQLMRSAAKSQAYQGINEFSFLAYPDSMRFALAKEDLVNKELDAAYGQYVHYHFEELFK
jgi:hypothetical protein